MLSQLFILSLRGDAIVTRDYRHDVPRASHDVFFRNLKSGEQAAAPVFHVDGVNYYHIKAGGLLLCATSRENLSPSLVLELLQRVGRVIKDYCGVLTEDSLRKNFVLVYELLDEMIDFGYGQSTSTEALKACIVNDPVTPAPTITQLLRPGTFGGEARAAPAVANRSVLDRLGGGGRGGPKRSEIFVDVIERLAVTINSSGYVLTSEVDGCIQCRAFLQGGPQVRMALNEDLAIGRAEASSGEYSAGRVVLDDCNFHERCVLDSFDTERTLTLTPPEGEFVVMSYRTAAEFKPPFRAVALVEESAPFKVEVVLKLHADFPAANTASSVVVKLPLPKTVSHVSLSAGSGQQAGALTPRTFPGSAGQRLLIAAAEFDEAQKVVTWTFRKMAGGSEAALRIRVTLTQERSSNVRREMGPVSINFSIPMYNVSRMQVRYLQIMEKNPGEQPPHRWVRYITQSSSYVCRI